MGGDDSQKLLPWRGIHSSPGRKPPAQLRINNVTETAGWNLARGTPSFWPRPQLQTAWATFGEQRRVNSAARRSGGRGYQNGGPPFANLSPRLSLFSDHLRTVLAVKGSLRRAQQRRALDGSGPFRTTLLRRGKGSLRTAPPGRGPLRRHFGTLFRRHRQILQRSRSHCGECLATC